MAHTRYQAYLAAVDEFAAAAAAMDQAVALLKDAHVTAQAECYRRPTHQELLRDTHSLVEQLRGAACEDCQRPLAECYCPWLHAEVR